VKTYYQVWAVFSLSKGKPELEKLSLNSVSEFFPFLFMSGASSLSLSRFFRSVVEAGKYVNYLFSRYPECPARRPVLDEEQQLLSFGP
jgi:hypothetical protein